MGILLLVLSLIAVGHGQVSDQELLDISAQVWADSNNMVDGVDYNTGGSVLFNSVDEGRLNSGTYGLLQNLMPYYNSQIGEPDNCGSGTACYNAQEALLDAVMASQPMSTVHTFLAGKGLASSSVSGFRAEVRQYFFQGYSRSSGAAIDSSGFEHAFLGEVRGANEVTGFHGWIQSYLQEKSGAFKLTDYQAVCDPHLPRFGFTWVQGGTTYVKSVSSISVGSSVEAELALFTLCFQARQTSSCGVMLNSVRNTVTTFEMSGVTPRTVGTSYIAC